MQEIWFHDTAKSSGEGNGNPLQYSCLGNPMERGAMGSQRVRHNWVQHSTDVSPEGDHTWFHANPHQQRKGRMATELSTWRFSSVAQSCSTLWDPINCSTPGLMCESVMPSSHLILCRPLLLLHPISPSIRIFSNESTLCMRWPKYWSFSLGISPSNEHPGLVSFRMDWLDLLAVQGTRQESSLTPQFKSINSLALSFLHMKFTEVKYFAEHHLAWW